MNAPTLKQDHSWLSNFLNHQVIRNSASIPCLFNVFLGGRIHVSHLCESANWKKVFQVDLFYEKFQKAFSIGLKFLELFQNKNLLQTENTSFSSLFESSWNGKYSVNFGLFFFSPFLKWISQYWHPIISLLLRIFGGMGRGRNTIYQAVGTHVLFKQSVIINLSLKETQFFPILYSQLMYCNFLSFIYKQEN